MFSLNENNQLDNPLIIKDIVVVSPKTEKDKVPPTGEFGTIPDLANLMSPKNHRKLAQFKWAQEDRLYSTIKSLVHYATDRHQEQNCGDTNQILPSKENAVTRLVTNEFAFYTAIPFSIEEFAHLQERIAALAERSPENLHLILSSFALLTPDKKVMDVVVHVQCGKNPKFNFIVKNNTADSDPQYSDYSVSADEKIKRKKLFPNVDINDQETKLDSYEIRVNGVKHQFSYNNIVECMTAGGVPFFTAIDICLDHEFEVAKNNANKLIDDLHESYLRGEYRGYISLLVSYLVTSNYINVKRKYGLGVITQADPIQSLKECKEQTEKSSFKEIKLPFGPPLIIIETSPLECGEWPEQQRARVIAHNNDVLGIENPKGETKKIKKALSHDMMDELSSDESDEEGKPRDNDILEDIITSLKQCEKGYAGHSAPLLSWMTTQSIDPLATKHKVFLKNELKQLREQIKKILKSSRIINKAEQAHKLLSATLQSITDKDDNLRHTRVFQLCEMNMKSIEAEYPDLRRNLPTQSF
ncbi:hypothetical protein Lnau_1997 [Legionella nautarum]|uniref:Uncharacterized protein n=1 Tax=Legionella nautarum TaxID=45070 RepID=A0A0W0WS17_9GAMM|nr:hypothetical protein [Legionella nautarum]KTD35107.1 hypothetical protein Lnau_1997 [Legionella nautarum]